MRERQIVGCLLTLHTLVWWLLPALLQHNLPLDVVELLAWGREWQFVYYKHPPLPAWVLEAVAVATARWPPAIYLTGAVSSALALLAVWRLARELVGEQRALLAVVAQEGVLYFTIFTPEFNHNVVLLPIWAALGLAGYRALFEPRSGVHWVSFGALAALGMLGKYTTALLLLPLLALSLLHPRLRRVWGTPGPWLAIGVALVLLLPHLLALWQIDFAPLFYASDRTRSAVAWYDRLKFPGLFAAAQFGDIAAALLAVALLAWRRPGEATIAPAPTPLRSDVRAYLWTITWAPFALTVAGSAALGLHFKDMWGYPMWCFVGVFMLAEVVGPYTARGVQRFAIAIGITVVVVLGVFTVQNTFGPAMLAKPARTAFPGPELARAVEEGWRAVSGPAPLAIVVGDSWPAGNVAFYARDRPAVFIDASFASSPWIGPDDVAQRGAVLIWPQTGWQPAWRNRFPTAVPQPPIELPYVPALGHTPARFEWAIVPPHGVN